MRKKRLIGWMVGIPALVVTLILVIIFHEPKKDGITRAMAAKSVALAIHSPEELAAWQQEYGVSHYPVNSLDQWYILYMDYLYAEDYLLEEETPAKEQIAEGKLTYGEAARIARQLSPELETLIKVTKKNQDQPYPEELWWLFYDSVLRLVDSDGAVSRTPVLIYGTPENIPGTKEWTAYTNLGEVTFYGLALDAYIDHELDAYVRDQEIIHILADQGSQVTYQNVWIMDGNEQSLQLYVGDIEREFSFKKKPKNAEALIHNIADIQLEDGKVTKISLKKERLIAKVLSINDTGIELEGYGTVPLDDECKVLKIYGDIRRQKLTDILVGYDMQEFVVADGKICAALTIRPFEADKIRVLIMNAGFQGVSHEGVSIVSEGSMNVTQGEQRWEVAAGEALTLNAFEERLQGGRLIIEPQPGCELTISSLERSLGSPSYSGRLECMAAEDGIVVINEIYLEDYLKKVVPSEMMTSSEKEALKAQAVCARTYAYIQMQGNNYSQYGAHVDDSTNYQVYNNIANAARSDAAVEETYGKLILHNGEPIPTYYFSTSCGTTTDIAVWGSEPEKTPYLKSTGLQPGKKTLDLSSEEAFSAFIKNWEYPAYDSGSAFYRWQVTTTSSILTDNIEGVGIVKDIRITDRGAGGVANTLLVTGSEGEKTISRQDNIRAALGDGRLKIKRLDGKESTGWSSLPSGFLTIEHGGTNDAGETVFKIYGGGYGHGVGMSQNGAQGMAEAGMNYEEILRFFYDGVTISEIGSQEGA